VLSAHEQTEGAGVRIWRPFPGRLPLAAADPFLLLDQAGPMLNRPTEARGAPLGTIPADQLTPRNFA
jgi:quercetin 2,3-dioxygenase